METDPKNADISKSSMEKNNLPLTDDKVREAWEIRGAQLKEIRGVELKDSMSSLSPEKQELLKSLANTIANSNYTKRYSPEGQKKDVQDIMYEILVGKGSMSQVILDARDKLDKIN
jgi:hypothetical protein